LDAKITIVESITSKRDFYRKNFLLVEPIITRLYQLYPQNSKVVDIYIHHLVAANRIKEALEVLKQRLSKDKPTIEELDRIIELEVYLDRYDSVEEYVDRGIELYPTHDKFWNLKAWLQTKRGDNQGAINTLKTALKQTKEPAARSSIWGSIGDQYYELKAFKKSYAAYNKALSYNFDNVVVLNNYAYHLSTMGKSLNQALTMAKRATELSPNNGTYLDTLAWVYYKLGEYEEAKKTMQQAMSFDKSNSSELALHYGDILDALGNTFMAQTYWRKALERGADASLIESRIEAQKARLEAQKAGK
ncbi:MAG: tetratricopeptide repeat protein, partial [Alistipes sp.]|nr:tetratricopeptide repeat protein [Alistipes sp.]